MWDCGAEAAIKGVGVFLRHQCDIKQRDTEVIQYLGNHFVCCRCLLGHDISCSGLRTASRGKHLFNMASNNVRILCVAKLYCY